MSKSVRVENEAEELIALQAIETYRALQHAVKTAPHGKGLATVEAVVHDKGFDHLRQMYQSALREHPEAQKKGSALSVVPAERSLPSDASRPSTC